MNYERFELANGLRVLVAPIPATRSVTTAVFLGVGSRYESSNEAGSAHLLEHLMFRGTKRRPSSRAVSETLERVGGVINASTDKEATVYWTKTASEDLALSLDLLADMLQNSRLTPMDLRKEQQIVVEELGMSMDDPQDWIHTLVDEALWPGHELGRDVAGSRESVASLSRSTIRRFRSTFYGPNNALLVVAGGIESQNLREMALEYFGDWSPVQSRGFAVSPISNGAKPRLQERPGEQCHFCLAYPALSRYSPDRYALDLLVTILGGSSTSRLFLEVRERRSLAYDVHAYATKLADTGSLVIYAGVDPKRCQQAVLAVKDQVDRLRKRTVPADELQKTLSYMKGRLYLGLEDTHAVASWLGGQELLMNNIMSPEDLVAALERVTARDIRRLANDLLRPESARVAAIGPGATQVPDVLLQDPARPTA